MEANLEAEDLAYSQKHLHLQAPIAEVPLCNKY